jgi:hypothetical protein
MLRCHLHMPKSYEEGGVPFLKDATGYRVGKSGDAAESSVDRPRGHWQPGGSTALRYGSPGKQHVEIADAAGPMKFLVERIVQLAQVDAVRRVLRVVLL